MNVVPELALLENFTAFTSVDLRAETDLVRRFQQDVDAAGLVGEKENAATVLFSAISARLNEPVHLTVFGESSAGKNYLLNTVSNFLPQEMVKRLTGMTPKTLMHSGEKEFQHKAVFIAEYEGVNKADYAIRTMQSEKYIEWDFVDSKNGIQKKTNRVNGPAAFLQATTRSVLHPENETRLLFIRVDQSETQTGAILDRQARDAERGAIESRNSLFEPWQNFFGELKLTNVRVPFASKITPHFPYSQVRSRRDFPKLLALIKISAFIHQHQREKDGDWIIANRKDYEVARVLYQHCVSTTPEKMLEELLEAVQEIAATGEFKAADVMQRTGWGHTKTYELLNRAQERGCVGEGDTRGRFTFLRNCSVEGVDLPEII